MKVLILRSRKLTGGRRTDDAYTQEFTGAFAQKVVRNLNGEPGTCAACGQDCTACRKAYDRRFAADIAGEVALPASLPYLLEDPARHVPRGVPAHDVLLAIHVHEQIVLEFLKRCRRWGARGAVVPLEAPGWVSPSARAEAQDICRAAGVEIAFPKPFCDFDPPAGTVLGEFRDHFRIGKPRVELTVRDERIREAHVAVSAACGATYYVARWLVGKSVRDDLKYDVIAKRLHSYPCTASMAWDDALGDTVMHVSGQAHYEILAPLAKFAPPEPQTVMSPLGRTVLKPAAPGESLRNIQRAQEAILEDLACGQPVSVESLRKKRRITPAAAYSAVLILKQQGKVRTEGRRVVKA